MRRLPALALAASVAATGLGTDAARADRRAPAERFTVRAEVVDVRPVYREVRVSEPRRECWTEHETYSVERRAHAPRPARRGGDALVGGVIGGVIGNRLGRGASDGARAGATIAGAVVGATVANEGAARRAHHRRDPYRHRRDPHRRRPDVTVRETRPVERCRTVEATRYEERLDRYDVTYRHAGRTFVTSLAHDPGPWLELRVALEPVRR